MSGNIYKKHLEKISLEIWLNKKYEMNERKQNDD